MAIKLTHSISADSISDIDIESFEIGGDLSWGVVKFTVEVLDIVKPMAANFEIPEQFTRANLKTNILAAIKLKLNAIEVEK